MDTTKETDSNVFKKLKKIFSFNENNNTDVMPFVPKELAQQIVFDDNIEQEIKDKLKIQPETTRFEKKKPVKYKKSVPMQTILTPTAKGSIFDLTNLSDVNPNLKLKVQGFDSMDFGDRIFNLFDIAKQVGMPTLDIDQATVGYYNVYSKMDKDDIKTKDQVAKKIYALVYYKKKNYRNASLLKVDNATSTYRLSD